MFDTLYNEEIISDDGFLQWKSSTDLAEQAGKREALRQSNPFFKWLTEAEDYH